MVLRYARFGVTLLTALLAAVAAPSVAVLAADPPPGVVFDGSVTVDVRVDSLDQANPLGPGVAGAHVRLRVLRAGPEPEADRLIQTLAADTDAAGIATFSGVGRPAEGGPAIALVADAHLDGPVVPVGQNCFSQESWDAAPITVEGGAAVSIQLVAGNPSALWCVSPPPEGAVLAATGRPQVTPPATDVDSNERASAGAAGLAIAGLLVVAAFALIPLRPRRLASVRATTRR